jgi:hypothetical protein
MLQNNPWGLPSTLEVTGNQTPQNALIVREFLKKGYTLVSSKKWICREVSNPREKTVYNPVLKKYFVSTRYITNYTKATKWWYEDKSKVKRTLKINFEKISLNQGGFIPKFKMSYFLIKGVNKEQFEKDFLKPEEQFLLTQDGIPTILADNFIALNLKRVVMRNGFQLLLRGENVDV